MPVDETSIADDPKEALRVYIMELEREYYSWYNKASRNAKRWWGIGHAAVILAGVFAAALAVLLDQFSLNEHPALRLLLVLLPIVGAMVSSILLQARVRELLTLRSIGLEEIQNLIARAKADYAAAASDPARLYEIHTALIYKVSEVERTQATAFRSIFPSQLTSRNQQNAASAETLPANPAATADRKASLSAR